MPQLGQFFRTIFLVDLLKGLWLTLRYTPQPAFTFQYPAERRPVSPRFRGVLRLQVEPETGAATCIVCDQCAKACPDDLIILGQAVKFGRRQFTADLQGLVGERIAFDARVSGMAMDAPSDAP